MTGDCLNYSQSLFCRTRPAVRRQHARRLRQDARSYLVVEQRRLERTRDGRNVAVERYEHGCLAEALARYFGVEHDRWDAAGQRFKRSGSQALVLRQKRKRSCALIEPADLIL